VPTIELEQVWGRFKSDVVAFFEENPTKIYAPKALAALLEPGNGLWWLGRFMTVGDLIPYLLENTKFSRAQFAFPSKKLTRYVWGEVPIYLLVLSLSPEGYFSHYTALYLNELTEQIPKMIYLNTEQPAKPGFGSHLTQDGIDSAFRNEMRISNMIAQYGEYSARLVGGKNVGRLGVVDFDLADEILIPVTGIERTLIDTVVRPPYSGEITEVAKAFVLAKDRVSVNRMVAFLKKMNFVYPYHQAIGYYLEKADYTGDQIDLLRKIPMEYDFYLTYAMQNPRFVTSWRLWVPHGF
jgi:hypothetical protein